MIIVLVIILTILAIAIWSLFGGGSGDEKPDETDDQFWFLK
jgi:hypothetical protein